MPLLTNTITIESPPDAVYQLAKKMEDFPRFMPDVKKVTVTEEKENYTITQWVTDVDGTPFLWTEKDLFDDEKKRIDYHLIEGDLEKFEGSWTFNPCEEGTLVTLTVDYDFGLPELTALIGPTIQEKVGDNSKMMLRAMKSEIEGG